MVTSPKPKVNGTPWPTSTIQTLHNKSTAITNESGGYGRYATAVEARKAVVTTRASAWAAQSSDVFPQLIMRLHIQTCLG